MRMAIFTDLDGTLLDHEDYSWDEAKHALALIKALDIPLIFNTSKTFSEVVALSQEMGFKWPFVVENGGAVFFWDGGPKGCVTIRGFKAVVLGKRREELLDFLRSIGRDFGLIPISDIPMDRLQDLVNLPAERIEKMSDRMFSEPFLIEEITPQFLETVRDAGFRVVKGGRFYHLISIDQDKGRAVELLKEIYDYDFTVGLGDSYNDVEMLRAVDLPILIPNPDIGYAKVEVVNLLKAKCMGPRGWSEEVLGVLNRFQDLLKDSM